jgi:hypothetical protein
MCKIITLNSVKIDIQNFHELEAKENAESYAKLRHKLAKIYAHHL